MPYNNRYPGGPEDYYQQSGSNFNPYTGRLNGGNMVLEFLARLAGQKEQKKKEQWEMEDRSSEMEMRKLQQTQAEQGIAMNQRKIQDYQKPVSPAAQFVMDRLGAVAQHQQRLEELDRASKNRIKEIQLRPLSKTAKELDSDYLADVADVEKQYAGMEVAARGELQKTMTAIVNNRFLSPDTYEADVKAAKDQYKEYVETIAAKREATMRAIDERYSDIPRAKMSSAKRSKAKPAEAPAAPAAPAIKVAGTKKRSEIGKNVVKVGPDGKKYTKIDGVIYEVID